MTKPLQDLLVVSLEQAVAAPYRSARLADAGARVSSSNAPKAISPAPTTAPSGIIQLFRLAQPRQAKPRRRHQEPDDAALLHRLLARADVFIQNLAPGAAARVRLRLRRPARGHRRLITVDISGYGETGEYAAMKAYDLLVQAESGLAMVTGHPAGPGRVGVSIADIGCGMNAYTGVLEALFERGITGAAAALKVSLFDAVADWMNVPLLYFEGTGTRAAAPRPRTSLDLPVRRVRHQRRRAGTDLDPERARMGHLLRRVPR